MKPINKITVKKLIKTIDVGLVSGLGNPTPGSMCVEAAVCYALGLPHGDDPGCVDAAVRALKIKLNDSDWSSNAARAKGLRKLAVLQLGTKDNFDQKHFVESVIKMTVREFVAPLFDAKWPEHAKALREAETMKQNKNAANAADAANAAYAAYTADAAYTAAYAAYAAYAAAAYAAADAARAAADAAADAARDDVLQRFADRVADILIAMNVPSVVYLDLL